MKYKINNIIHDTFIEAQTAKNLMSVVTLTVISSSLFRVGNVFEEYHFNNLIKAEEKKAYLEDKVYPDTLISEISDIDYTERYRKCKAFAVELIDMFMIDNWTNGMSISFDKSNALMTKFQNISHFADKGDIRSVSIILPTIEIDDIFTQERKDKYISIVESFISLNY